MNKYRLTQFLKHIFFNRLVPVRYYVIEFFFWVICRIDFYKNYRRFYKKFLNKRINNLNLQ